MICFENLPFLQLSNFPCSNHVSPPKGGGCLLSVTGWSAPPPSVSGAYTVNLQKTPNTLFYRLSRGDTDY